MRTFLTLLLLIMMAPVFAQKMSKKPGSPFMPSFPGWQQAQKDSIEQVLLYRKSLKPDRKTPNYPQEKNEIPNAIREKAQALIYKGKSNRGSIYQSPVDNMLMLAPDSTAIYHMPTGSVRMIPIKP